MDEHSPGIPFAARLFAAARRLEQRHKSNLAKYYFGMALSETVKQANNVCVPTSEEEFSQYIDQLNEELRLAGVSEEIMVLLHNGLCQLTDDGDFEIGQFPPIYISTESGDVSLDESWEPDWVPFVRTALLRPMDPVLAVEFLTTGPASIRSLIQNQSDDDLTRTTKSDEWSIQTILEHLILGETLLHGRTILMLTHSDPTLEYLPVDLTEDSYGDSPEQVLRRYEKDRTVTLRVLEGISRADWYLRTGLHTIYGRITLQEHVSFFARYERENIRRIKRICAELATG